MKKTLAALGAIVAMLLATAAPSVASHENWFGGKHWGNYYWNGVVGSDSRGLWIMDRTGNPLVQDDIAEFVGAWNNLALNSGLFNNFGQTSTGTNLPVVNWFKSSDRGCGPYANDPLSYSVIVVCNTDLNSWGKGGPTHSVGGHIRHAVAKFDYGAPVGNETGRILVWHEIIHAMGLGHCLQPCTSLMEGDDLNGNPNGSPFDNPYGTFLSNHDKYVLQVLYNHQLP